jgi:hypothetical protein
MPDDNLYNQQIGIAYWYVTHKQMIRMIVSIILLVIIFVFVAINLYLLIFNLGIYGSEYNAYLNSFPRQSEQYLNFIQGRLPQSIAVGQISTLINVNNYDIVAQVSNPNAVWYATFNYQFVLAGEQSEKRLGFILPGESKKLIDLNVANGNLASDLVISDIKWYKEINYSALKAEKFNLEVKNISLIPAALLGLGEKISQVKFSVTNNSAFNYADIGLQIYLLAGNQIVAVNQIYSGKLNSGQTQNYQVNFFQSLPKISEVSIIPEINILDSNAFLKF